MDIGQWVHFGIYDVINCFRWIHENLPESIFEEPMLKKITEWHQKYNICCNLYVLEKQNGFSLSQLEDKYWKQFSDNSTWIKIAWLRKTNEETSGDEYQQLKSLQRTNKLILSKCGKKMWGKSTGLLQGNVTQRLINELKLSGVTTIFTLPDNKKVLPFPSEIRNKLMDKGFAEYDGMCYQKVDICLDSLEMQPIPEALKHFANTISRLSVKPKCVVYFHEQKFSRIRENADKFWNGICNIETSL